jgi:catenin alpha
MVNWDTNETDDLVDLQTKSIDQTLQPLINQLACLTTNSTTDSLFNQNDLLTNRKKPGRSKRAHILVESVCEAIETFIRQGADIAQDNPEMSDEIMQTIAQIRLNGNEMAETARDFANDPLCTQKRLVMIKASRDLLNTVGRLLSLADMIDINLLLGSIQIVQQDLINLKNSSNQDELTHHFKIYGRNIVELTSQAGRRQADLKDTRLKDELAAARATLKKQSMKLYSAAKTLLRHPELSAAQSNHDFVFKEVYDAVDKIHGITTNRISSENIKHLYDEAASLSAALDEMDKQIININPNQFNETRMRSKFESQLENIISAVALMADSESTRPNRRDRIVDECNVLRQALQDLLNAYINNNRNGGVGGGAQIEHATIEMTKMTKNLRRQLRKAVIDHISDSFLETNLPLETMIEIARQGQDEKQLADSVQIFMDHVEKLLEVSSMACSMSNNTDGIKLVRMAAIQVQTISPQAVNGARILFSRNTSKVAIENMDVFREAWLKSVRLLSDSVDDITMINDFLSVSENHILEDLNRCVMALREQDAETLDRTAGAIRGRTARVCNVVCAETDLYEPDEVTNKVLESVSVLRDQLIPNFARSVDYAVASLGSQKDPDDNGFIEASRLVYDGVHEVRNAVLMLNDNGYESESDLEDYAQQSNPVVNHYETTTNSYWSSSDHYRAELEPEPLKEDQFKNFSQEQREQIQRQLESFRQEKRNFDREVLKWDDKGNDIIVLAKQMCVIMMEMTDFTRGRGPLKTTMDIINAAKKISECGGKLDKLARDIAEECPESQSKRELDAYLKPIPLFCNQLNIASKVKANVIDVSGEPIITGLDSATSLIISAKNLMTAVVSVVKASYVASTKYTSKTGSKKVIFLFKINFFLNFIIKFYF